MTLAGIYFLKQYIKFLSLTFLFSVSLIFVLDLGEIIRIGSSSIVLATLVKGCKNIIHLMPLIMLIGTIITFVSLTKRNELVIFTTLGLPNAFFLKKISLVVILVFLVIIGIIIPISTFLNLNSSHNKITFHGQELVFKTSDNIFIRTSTIDSKNDNKVTVFILDNDFALEEVITAENSHIENNLMILKEVTVESKFLHNKFGSISITLNVTSDHIENSILQPEQISLLAIPAFISNLKKIGFSTSQYERYFCDEIAVILNLFSMALLGFISSFSLVERLAKKERIFYGIVAGLVIFFIQDLIVTILPYSIGISVILAKVIIAAIVISIYATVRD
jgi:lipopolysaccharide export LptBFGC system permease protein LptF